MGAKIYILNNDMTFSDSKDAVKKDKPVTDPKMTRIAEPEGTIVSSEPTYTMGRDVEVGDELKVYWTPGKDTVLELLPHEGSALHRNGARRAIFFFNKQGMVLDNDDMYDVIGKNKEVAATKGERTHGAFFKTKGAHLRVGDKLEVTWSKTGDTIIRIEPYIGPLLNLMSGGAHTVTFMNWDRPITLDDTKIYNVISRFPSPAQGVNEDLLDRESEPMEYEQDPPINDEELLQNEGSAPPITQPAAPSGVTNGMEIVKYGDLEWRRWKRTKTPRQCEVAVYEG